MLLPPPPLQSECAMQQQLNFKDLDVAVCSASPAPTASHSSPAFFFHGKTTTVPHGKLSRRGCRFVFCSVKMIGYMTFYLMTLFGWPLLLCFVQPATGLRPVVVPEISGMTPVFYYVKLNLNFR